MEKFLHFSDQVRSANLSLPLNLTWKCQLCRYVGRYIAWTVFVNLRHNDWSHWMINKSLQFKWFHLQRWYMDSVDQSLNVVSSLIAKCGMWIDVPTTDMVDVYCALMSVHSLTNPIVELLLSTSYALKLSQLWKWLYSYLTHLYVRIKPLHQQTCCDTWSFLTPSSTSLWKECEHKYYL